MKKEIQILSIFEFVVFIILIKMHTIKFENQNKARVN